MPCSPGSLPLRRSAALGVALLALACVTPPPTPGPHRDGATAGPGAGAVAGAEAPATGDASRGTSADAPDEAAEAAGATTVAGGSGGRFGGRYGGRGRLRASGGRAAAPRETYVAVAEPGFLATAEHPLSTFAVDVDTASYANVRRFLRDGTLPPPEAVRVEELLNAFRYDDAPPTDGEALAVEAEVASCPWRPGHRLLRVALRGRSLDPARRPPANLVFLVDVSGSMRSERKLPLARQALRLLVERLDARDRVALVTYASGTEVVLEPTLGSETARILAAIDGLRTGGGTHGEAGIREAYRLARRFHVPGAVSRVVLATDGDFNVGVTGADELAALVAAERERGIDLTVLGFGGGSFDDAVLEALAHRGDGQYVYVDSLEEARRVFQEGLLGTLVVVARDAKVQLELDPLAVASHRLVGYASRRLEARDFADDRVDAGDVGAGHAVVALYELVPAAVRPGLPAYEPEEGVEPLRYRLPEGGPSARAGRGELGVVRVRYRPSGAAESVRREVVVRDGGASWRGASHDLRFSAAVALFALGLAGGDRGDGRSEDALELAAAAAREWDPWGERAELVELVHRARALGAR